MSGPKLDEIDRTILNALHEDARHNTNASISERVSVSASTVGKRIFQLEQRGVIKAHRSEIDYEKLGFPLHVLFICTVSIVDRENLIEQTLELDGVVHVRELMTGQRNAHIRTIGSSKSDITCLAYALDDLGYVVNDEILIRTKYTCSSIRIEDAVLDE